MILGCALGTFVGKVIYAWGIIEGNADENDIKNFTVLGTAAVLAGYTRLTFSLAVIMMETSQTINLFVPIFFTIIISNKVGALFTRGLYDRAVRGKQMPILRDFVPLPCKGIIAEQMMTKDVVTLERVDTLDNVLVALESGHHSFPILNKNKNIIGMIPRNFIIVLLINNGYYR